MPKSKDPNEGRERREHEQRDRAEHGREDREHYESQHGEREHEGNDEKNQPRRRRKGREHAVHEQIVERRLGGGAPATPEAYAKALEEWHQIPGSVVRPPTDEKPATTPKKDAEEGDKENRS